MADPRQALEAQLHNLQQRSGQSLTDLFVLLGTETTRLIAPAPGGMCGYTLRLGRVGEVDAEVRGLLKAAYGHAGS